MSASQAVVTPLPTGAAIPAGTLRAEMESRRAARERFTIKEALAIVVPLCTRLREVHAEGKTLFVHPSSLGFVGGELTVLESHAHAPPELPRDRACLAPEERKGAEGDARASVFTIGALLYELLTGQSVGPGMRRPADLVPDLPPALETVLGKALVADPKHRPGDLAALAQALHQVMPGASQAPPPADESHLDHEGDFDVDVSMSMIPPPPKAPAIPGVPSSAGGIKMLESDGPYNVAVPTARVSRPSNDPTARLSDMKARLESDPRPRYVVVKDGMDHGPFSAVELLQQIASGQFVGENVLRDSLANEERFIKDWDEFAPFAEHAKLNQEIKQEKQQLEVVVAAEKQGTQYKALIGVAILGLFLAIAAGWWMRQRQNRERELAVQADSATNVDIDGGLGGGKKAGGAPGGGGGVHPAGGGNYPSISGGGSCEAAIAHYNEEYKIGNNGAPPDLGAADYGNVLNRGGYLGACGVPSSMSISICVAVQNGRAVGVTVSTSPSNPKISSCISGQVRGLGFPSHPRMDVARTTFAAN